MSAETSNNTTRSVKGRAPQPVYVQSPDVFSLADYAENYTGKQAAPFLCLLRSTLSTDILLLFCNPQAGTRFNDSCSSVPLVLTSAQRPIDWLP